jgi:hypothetical protein
MGSFGTPILELQAQAGAQQASTDTAKARYAQRAKKNGFWFYWIAGLSIVDSVISLSRSTHHLWVRLDVTRIFEVAGPGMGGIGSGVALTFRLGLTKPLVFLNSFACKAQLWAFVVGMLFVR